MYGDTTCTGTGSYNGTMTCSALIETSDANLKENLREANTKECYKAVKYVKPKTYNFTKDEEKKSHSGFMPDDFFHSSIPPEWDKLIYHNDDGMTLLAYKKHRLY